MFGRSEMGVFADEGSTIPRTDAAAPMTSVICSRLMCPKGKSNRTASHDIFSLVHFT
jgi:hypothetical protein